MAAEAKPECKCEGLNVKWIIKALVGFLLIAAGIYLSIAWRSSLLLLIKGCLGPFLALVGLVFVAIAKE